MIADGADAPNLSRRARGLIEEPSALHWAQVCGWVPGTGHCRRRDCGDDCVFRTQREAEARAVLRWRRLRRMFRRPLVR
jgi:hypothetical protein